MTQAIGSRVAGMLMLVLIATLVSIAPGLSADLSGSDDPEFAVALDLWLQGDDLVALNQFSALAHGDNTAAQILLALIDKTAALPGAELTGLARADRIALLRDSGGISGRNWMHAAAETSDIAQTWVALWQMEGGTELARHFAQHNEPRATREALLTIVSRTESGFSTGIRAQEWYPASLAYLTANRLVTPDDLDGLPPHHPLQERVGSALTRDQLQDWLATDELALPLRSACDSMCPATRNTCMAALYDALGGYPALLVMGSPVASLVSDADFAESPRGITSVARRVMLRHSARTRMILLRNLADMDICAANWLDAEFKRYASAKRTAPAHAD